MLTYYIFYYTPPTQGPEVIGNNVVEMPKKTALNG